MRFMDEMPTHVAIIPDGNRRWAKKRGLPEWEGHRKGAETLKKLLSDGYLKNIKCLSFWGLSKDNVIKRSKLEVATLMKLYARGFKGIVESKEIHLNKVKINAFGWWREMLPKDVVSAIQKAVDATKNYNEHYFNFMICYNGNEEMLMAVENIVKNSKDKNIKITPELIKRHLFTKDLPPVDLVIRTGGDAHLSNGFMMWDTADAKIYFSEKLWPDFDIEEFKKAVELYNSRERNFGR